jgi:hypothetical protein
MTLWLQCQEAIDIHSRYLDWIHHKIDAIPLPADHEVSDDDDDEPESETGNGENIMPDKDGPVYHITKTCPHPHLPVALLGNDFGAINFIPALTFFLKKNVPQHHFIQPGAMDCFKV